MNTVADNKNCEISSETYVLLNIADGSITCEKISKRIPHATKTKSRKKKENTKNISHGHGNKYQQQLTVTFYIYAVADNSLLFKKLKGNTSL